MKKHNGVAIIGRPLRPRVREGNVADLMRALEGCPIDFSRPWFSSGVIHGADDEDEDDEIDVEGSVESGRVRKKDSDTNGDI